MEPEEIGGRACLLKRRRQRMEKCHSSFHSLTPMIRMEVHCFHATKEYKDRSVINSYVPPQRYPLWYQCRLCTCSYFPLVRRGNVRRLKSHPINSPFFNLLIHTFVVNPCGAYGLFKCWPRVSNDKPLKLPLCLALDLESHTSHDPLSLLLFLHLVAKPTSASVVQEKSLSH